MAAQLTEARRVGIDVLWWTDHDWRLQAVEYWGDIPFDQARVERDGLGWQWQQVSNSAGNGSHDFRTPPTPTELFDSNSALYLSHSFDNDSVTESRGVDNESVTGYAIKAVADRATYRTSLAGQQMNIEIYPDEIGGAGFLAFDLITSLRPETGGREAGTYRLSYRVGGGGQPGSAVAQGRLGVITQEAPVGQWSTWSIDPAADISTIWPEIDGRDACSFEIVVSAQADAETPAAGYFGGLQINRTGITGNEPLETQRELMELYRDEFGSVTQLLGTEVSLAQPHLGAYGGDLAIPIDAGDVLQNVMPPDEVGELVSRIQSQGSLVCYNHPFGISNEIAAPAEQELLVQQVATEVVGAGLFGAQMIEAGYRARGGVDLFGHLRVWDACSRAGVFTTGIGVNDNHSGMGWDSAVNNFTTWIWAQEATSAALTAALAQGRAYFGDKTLFDGEIDLTTAAGTRMGQVQESENHGSTLTVRVTGRPADSSVVLVSLDVSSESTAPGAPTEADYTRVTLTDGDFSDEEASAEIDPNAQRMYRVEVISSSQEVIACSNPVWLLSPGHGTSVPDTRYA